MLANRKCQTWETLKHLTERQLDEKTFDSKSVEKIIYENV